MLGLSEQELRESLERELILAMRSEGGVPTIHAIAHSIARILEEDHLRVTEQLGQAGVQVDPEAPALRTGAVSQVVVGFDGSAHAKRALERAAQLAGPATMVTVVAAVEVRVGAGRGPKSPVDPEDAARQERALADAKAFLAEHGVEAALVEGVGDPARAIVEAASAVGADLIILGSRGLNVAERLLLGSVSTRVVHHAPCDVLVVR